MDLVDIPFGGIEKLRKIAVGRQPDMQLDRPLLLLIGRPGKGLQAELDQCGIKQIKPWRPV